MLITITLTPNTLKLQTQRQLLVKTVVITLTPNPAFCGNKRTGRCTAQIVRMAKAGKVAASYSGLYEEGEVAHINCVWPVSLTLTANLKLNT